MDPARWRRMWSVFHGALEQAPGERDAFVDSEVGDDDELRRQVEHLLEDHDRAPSLLDALDDDVEERPDAMIGTRIAGYRLDRVIGRGGMGTVYAASQEKPLRRTVALKLITSGMDTAEVVARFEAERQTLALMDHPNIATVHDAGATEGGRPYFVMELVDGLPLLEFCDRERLSLDERLELFIAVCRAVQHAHQKGVIHRDLKPSNILVARHDGRPTAKIIDFGIAKAVSGHLADRTLRTVDGHLIGTPEYMSPEQASGAADIDTRSDVYSLGVVLYELLAGALPADRRPPAAPGADDDLATPSGRLATLGAEAESVARNRGTDERELRRQLRGELDWIVMRALEADRERRYATAAGLAADLERKLRHEPVVAGPPNLGYRLRKFVRRHRIGVAVVVTLTLTLILGIVGTTWMAIVARDERRAAEAARDRARNEAETARAVAALLDEMLAAPNPMGSFQADSATRDVKVIEVLDRASDLLPDLAGRPDVEAAFRRTLGKTYLQLGRPKIAEEHFQRAFDLNNAAHGPDHPDTLASAHHLAWAFKEQGRYDEAEAILEPVVERRREVLGPEHRETLASMLNLGNVLYRLGRLEQAERLFRELIPVQKRVLGELDPDVLTAHNSLAVVLTSRGTNAEAQTVAREALRLSRLVHGPEHPRTLNTLGILAAALEENGQLDEAGAAFRSSSSSMDARSGRTTRRHSCRCRTWRRFCRAAAARRRRYRCSALRSKPTGTRTGRTTPTSS